MTARRTYRQYCATAKTLDVIGERWTLLVIRELLTGPRRFKDLAASLPGVGTGLLGARLRHLEDAALIRRTTLPRPASVGAYELTEAGRELEPAIMALARWGLKWALGKPEPGDAFHPGWAVIALQAIFRPEEAAGVHESYEFRVEDEVFHARVDDAHVDSVYGPAWQPALTITSDRDTFRDLASGDLSLADAARLHKIGIDGDRGALRRFERIFRMPASAFGTSRSAPSANS